jgi:hypothetical protein
VAFSNKGEDQNMNAATDKAKGSAKVPVLYMPLELSDKTRRLALSGGATRPAAIGRDDSGHRQDRDCENVQLQPAAP